MHLTPKNRITIDPGWTLRNPTVVSAHPNKDVLLDELEGNQLSDPSHNLILVNSIKGTEVKQHEHRASISCIRCH